MVTDLHDPEGHNRALNPHFVIPASFWPESSLSAILDPGQGHAGVTVDYVHG
jgi:hypothetical protein